MNYIPFIDGSQRVSRICLGTMTFGDACDAAASAAIVREALDLGVNFFDTAPMYANGVAEEYLGRALEGRRQEVLIATKVHAGLDEATIAGSLDASLGRLRTDHVDLFLVHWPSRGMNLTVMMQALQKTIASGKARFVGCCNFPAWLLGSSNAVAIERGWPKLRCNQVAYNLIERGVEVEVLPQATTEGIFIMAYRPLAVGLLSGAFRPGTPLAAGKRGSTDSRVITWLSEHGRSTRPLPGVLHEKAAAPRAGGTCMDHGLPRRLVPHRGGQLAGQVREAAESAGIALDGEGYAELTDLFDTEVKEEGLQLFPGLKYNYPRFAALSSSQPGSRSR